MASEIERLRAQLEKAQAARKKLERQTQLLMTKLGKQERRADTRRKIINGAHMQTEALTNPAIAELLQQRRVENLVRDDDRALFELEPLSEIEKARRGVIVPGRRKQKAREANAGASAPPSDNSADAPREKESEAA